VTELLQLIQTRQLDFELQARRARRSSRQRNDKPSAQAFPPRRFHLAADEVNGPISVYRQHIVGKAGEVHS
jgi:hypothetical protein